MTIIELPLTGGPDCQFDVPADAKVLSVKTQGGVPTVFMLANPLLPSTLRRFLTVESGADLPPEVESGEFLETFTRGHGQPALHVFEVCAMIVLQMPQRRIRPGQ